MNKLSTKQCRHYQNNLYKMSDKELIKAVKVFFNSESVFYLNTDESVANWHDKLPLKTFGLSEYITDNYYIKHSNGNNYYGSETDHIILTCGKLEKLYVKIGREFGEDFEISWGWAHKHAHYEGAYLYDNFIIITFRNKKLERILNDNQ